MDTLFHEAESQELPSSAAVQTSLSLLEHELDLTAWTTPNPDIIVSLENYIAATTQTHVASIEENVPLLDIPVLSMGTPPSVSQPIPTAIFTSSVLVHDKVPPPNLLHNLSLVANALLPNQSEVQTSFSMAHDHSPKQQGGSEAVPPITSTSATTSTQPEVALTVPVLLQALMDVSTQFDDRLKAMQAEVHALRTQNAEGMQELKDMVMKLTSEVSLMRKGKGIAGDSQIQGEKRPTATNESEIPRQKLKRKREEGEKRYFKTTRFNTKTGQSEVFYETDWSEISSDESEKIVFKGKGKAVYISDQEETEEGEANQMETQTETESVAQKKVSEAEKENKRKQTEAEKLAKLQRYAKSAGMTVEEYREYVKGLYKEKFDFNPYDQSERAAAEFEDELQAEEEQAIEEEQMRVEADARMAKLVLREEARMNYIENNFTMRTLKHKITHLDCKSNNGNDLLLTCSHKGGSFRFGLSRLHTMGLEEWKEVANLSYDLIDKSQGLAVRREATFNMNTAHMLNLVADEDYRAFCIKHDVKVKAKSLGLESSSVHPVPVDIVFQDRTYIETEKHKGLCYTDCGGEECFQPKDSITTTSIHHCIALLKECESPQCLPFRMRLISWLFNNLKRIEEIGNQSDMVELVKKEYQLHFHKSDAEMKTLMDWKKDRLKWMKEKDQPVPFETSLRRKKRTGKKQK